jgi:ParB-like chromosome segregation protein Spo0J
MVNVVIFASLAILGSGERVSLQSQLQTKSQSKVQVEASANPIRRIVTMLQDMSKKVEAEGVKEKELYEKFMCYCKTSGETLGKSIDDAETKIPQLESEIKAAGAEAAQLIEDLNSHKASREDAKAAMAKATSIREKEAAAFAKENAEEKANLEALGKALTSIQKGMSGGFLQTSAAAVLRRLVLSVDLGNSDRDVMSAFLSGGDGYQPASGEIVGIMKQMKDTMEKDLADMIAAEETAKMEFFVLLFAKLKEIDMLTTLFE